MALVAQTLIAARLGHITPLTAAYVIPWIPLVMVTLIVGASRLARMPTRCAVSAFFLVAAIANTWAHHDPQLVLAERSLNNYRSVATLLASLPEHEAAVVYRSDEDAKLMNLFYSGNLLQMTRVPSTPPPLPGISTLVFVSSVRDPATPALDGWTPPQVTARFGETRVEVAIRTPPARGQRGPV
jgi:hypothetical protein